MRKIALHTLCGWLLLQGAAYAGPLTLSGSFYPSAQTKLSSQVSGRVEQVLTDAGDPVEKGQALVRLEPNMFAIEVAQMEALASASFLDLNHAETNFSRMQRLWEKPEGTNPSISQKRFEDAKMAYEQAKMQVVQAQAKLNKALINLDEATIKAPFSGVVTKRFVDPGEMVSNLPGTFLLEIQAIDPVYLEFSLSQSYLRGVHEGTPISFEVEGEDGVHEAKIDRIFPSLDEATRSAKCRAVVGNADHHFRPGSLVKVTVLP